MKATVENIEKFKKLYSPTLSMRENLRNMQNDGLEIALGTLSRWKQMYIDNSTKSEPEEIYITIPYELYDKVKELVKNYRT